MSHNYNTQSPPFQGQQNIEMGAHRGFNQQPQGHAGIPKPSASGYAVLNEDDFHTEASRNGAGSPPVVQQGTIYQSAPPGYPGHSYPVSYPPQQYPVYHGSNQMFGHPGQTHLAVQHNQVHLIENNIKGGFCCYTCLVYFGLVGSSLGFLAGLGADPVQLCMSGLSLAGYILALMARSNFDTKKQYYAFVIFCVHAVLSLIGTFVLVGVMSEQIEELMSDPEFREAFRDSPDPEQTERAIRALEGFISFFMIVIPLLLNLLLIHFSRQVYKLMKQRDQLLNTFQSATVVA